MFAPIFCQAWLKHYRAILHPSGSKGGDLAPALAGEDEQLHD
jgi:hypothetical protein